MRQTLSSWGNVIHAEHECIAMQSRCAGFPTPHGSATILARGNGRSYGDSCLNTGAALALTRGMDHFIAFDPDTGLLSCEAGVLLSEILALAVPAGWFLPVTPGTCYVTVGGAIANDVHGKNHHRQGTFCMHVRQFELLRSDSQRLLCSQQENPEWFAASAGGLGLTGIITWAQLQLRRIPGPHMDVQTIRFGSLDEFVALSTESEHDFEYTVSWVDCLARGRQLGRGLFQRANHVDGGARVASAKRSKSVPLTPPFSLINSASLRLFNSAYYHLPPARQRRSITNFQPFFYPLDGILQWNRLYGRRGFFQYQCVIPTQSAHDGIRDMLQVISNSGQGSFLAVLKIFGNAQSPALLSFPRPGMTLALDFPNTGAALEKLFVQLDAIVSAAGGRLYPAKDGRMPAALFRSGYPGLAQFCRYLDPGCSSSFWRRVMEVE